MSLESPIAGNPYWEILSEQDLANYDRALELLYEGMEVRKEHDCAILASVARAAAVRYYPLMQEGFELMPPIQAFYRPPGIPPEEE